MTEKKIVDRILQFKNIAVVGLSSDPAKESHRVAAFLKERGYRVVPINPTASEVLGQYCFASLRELPAAIAGNIETILVFRPSDETLDVLLQALQMLDSYDKLKAFWLQEGIKNAQTARFAKKAGLLFVQDTCMKKELQKRLGHKKGKARQ